MAGLVSRSVALALVVLLVVPGCVTVHCFAAPDREVDLVLAGTGGASWSVQVPEAPAAVVPDGQGRVRVTLPRLRSCRRTFCGVWTRPDPGELRPVLHVLRDGVVLRALSRRDLDALPRDADGRLVVELDA